jgi:hypothetical protein
MSTAAAKTSAEQLELEDAVARLSSRSRDPQSVRRACERMDRMREELRQRIGVVEMSVDLIRDARNQ